ncbi:MAG: polysaccharide biosynthesis/export family protein [Alphaproteobacteria bacterium]|nr:polysaccharide biosynthesis/export family protein [Alphaproteobacteria bacterium]
MEVFGGQMARALAIAFLAVIGICGCTSAPGPEAPSRAEAYSNAAEYVIGPGDALDVFVWKNAELSVKVPVRPDGRISIPLAQDVQAAGKTSNQLAADIRTALLKFVKDPVVTVIVQSVQTGGNERIMVIGAASNPRAVPYRAGLTVLDVMVEVGGLKEFAAGNRATLLRRAKDGNAEIPLRLADLLEDGKPEDNVAMLPGDVIRIPERWF